MRRETQRREEKLWEIGTWEIQEVDRMMILKYILRKKKGATVVCVGLIHLAQHGI